MQFPKASNPIRVRGPAKVLSLYVLFSVAWIAATDEILEFVSFPYGHTLKGVFYVLISGSILFWLCRQLVDDVQQMENTITEVFRQTEFGVSLTDPAGKIVACNEAFAELLGFSVAELNGRNASTVLHPEDLESARKDWNDTLVEKKTTGYGRLRRYVRKNRETVWARVAASRLDSTNGKQPILLLIAQNVTPEVVTAEALRKQQAELESTLLKVQQSEARFRRLSESSPTGIAVASTDGRITDCNSVLAEMLGYTREEVDAGALNWPEITPPEFDELDLLAIKELQHNQRFTPYEKEYIAKDGSRIPVMIFGSVFAERAEAKDLVVTVIDMRQRRAAQAELLRLESAVRSASEAIAISDLLGNLEYVNPAFEELTGYTRAEAVGKHVKHILGVVEAENEAEEEIRELVSSGRGWKGVVRTRHRDGTERLTEMSICMVRDATGTIVNHLAVARDIRRENRLEMQLAQAQKLEAVGQLTGGVAHDLNNVLQVVHSSVELALQKHDEAFREKKLSDVLAASARGAALISQLLAFTRKQPVQMKVLDLNLVVEDTVKMLRRLLPENIELTRKLAAGLKKVKADPVRLSQLLMNLVVNARDAMPDGGSLTIETDMLALGAATERVRLSVIDTGIGMDEQTLGHMFEPFYTTKGAGKGTGLGLATVKEVANQCGAEISVASKPGQGTTFTIDFLAGAEIDNEDPRERARPSRDNMSGTVLVCEDDPQVRAAVCEFLSGIGLRVIASSNAAEARRWAEREAPEYMVTDLIMPGSSGLELAEEMTKKYPDLRVMLITGHVDHQLLERLHSQKRLRYLQKPFTATSLLEELQKLSETPRANEVV